MSHRLSDPDAIPQFRRRWSEAPVGIKLQSEMSEHELDRLSERCGERRDLARAFGRPLVRLAQQRRPSG
jgi:hypothetical protein